MKKWTNWSAHFAWGVALVATLASLGMRRYLVLLLVGAFWVLWESGGRWLFGWRENELDLVAGLLGASAAVAWIVWVI